MSEEKLSLWNRHCHTDPSWTKQVDFGRAYTAINPTLQAKVATAEFGPYGKGWGLRDLEYNTFVTQGRLKKTDDLGPITSVSLVCTFWAASDIEFPVSADMPFKPGEDCYKKLRTQCQSKALALLGFSADIYQGDWEAEGYQEAMAVKFGDQSNREKEGMKAIAEAASNERLDFIADYVTQQVAKEIMDFTVAENLQARIAKRRKELELAKEGGVYEKAGSRPVKSEEEIDAEVPNFGVSKERQKELIEQNS